MSDAGPVPRAQVAGVFGAPITLITDGVTVPGRDGAAAVRDAARLHGCIAEALSAVAGGTIAVQLRNRELSGGELWRVAMGLRALTAQHGAMLVINDRLDVALAVEADGVHLPGHGLAVGAVRARVGDALGITAAAHSIAEAQAQAAAGADAVLFSPIWPTPSKPPRVGAGDPAARPPGGGDAEVVPLGMAALADAVRRVPCRVVALGGVDSVARAGACAQVGAGVACVRGLFLGDDVQATVRAFVAAITSSDG